MNVERGFRRLLVVVSIALFSAGLALDAGKLWSHARIYATLEDGTIEVYETWNLAGSPPYEQDTATRLMVQQFWAKAASPLPPSDPEWESGKVVVPGKQLNDPLDDAIRIAPIIKTFRVVRGPAAWSWADIRFISAAAGAVLLLWTGFFAVRWVARGFLSKPAP